MQQHESFINQFFLHSGHIVLLSAHVQNTTIVSFFTLMGILIVFFISNITPQIFYQ